MNRWIPVCLIVAALPVSLAAQSSRFEVASVRPNASGEIRGQLREQPDGTLIVTNLSLRGMLRHALGVFNHREIEGPAMLDQKFDITAKAPADRSSRLDSDTMRRMLLDLLTQRFRLSYHVEHRSMKAQVLRLSRKDGRLGPRLVRATSDCLVARAEASARPFVTGSKPVCSYRTRGAGNVEFDSLPIERLAEMLTSVLQTTVVDATGLSGEYSFTMNYSPTDPLVTRQRADVSSDPDGRPLLRDALRDQLGLSLTSEEAPVPFVVVDRLTPPVLD